MATISKEEMQALADGLRKVHDALDRWLKRAREYHYRDMVQVSPGVWINKRFKNLGEALDYWKGLMNLP